MVNKLEKKQKISDIILSNNIYISLIIFIVAFIICAICVPTILLPSNIINVLRMNSISGIMAIGMTLVMLTGEIDLSVGAIMSLSLAVGSKLIGVGQPVAGFWVTLLVGALAGGINGFIIAKSRVASLMVTLGMSMVYGGIANIVANGQATYLYDAQLWLTLGKDNFLGIPWPVIIFILLIVIFTVIMARTRFGRQVYFTGSNSNAGWLSGINIDAIKIVIFMICGCLAALAGPLLSAQVNRTIPTLGDGYEVTAIAIAVLGGTSLDGGKGSIAGTFLGVLTLGFLTNALSLSGMGTYVETALRGIIIIGIVVVYEFAKRRSR